MDRVWSFCATAAGLRAVPDGVPVDARFTGRYFRDQYGCWWERIIEGRVPDVVMGNDADTPEVAAGVIL